MGQKGGRDPLPSVRSVGSILAPKGVTDVTTSSVHRMPAWEDASTSTVGRGEANFHFSLEQLDYMTSRGPFPFKVLKMWKGKPMQADYTGEGRS